MEATSFSNNDDPDQAHQLREVRDDLCLNRDLAGHKEQLLESSGALPEVGNVVLISIRQNVVCEGGLLYLNHHKSNPGERMYSTSKRAVARIIKGSYAGIIKVRSTGDGETERVGNQGIIRLDMIWRESGICSVGDVGRGWGVAAGVEGFPSARGREVGSSGVSLIFGNYAISFF
ncbi:hypothetical protein Tco_1504396 [Tanacetum coccineum]